MPNQIIWEGFFDPEGILKTLGVGPTTGDVVDFGCGYGTFTIPAAKMIKGNVYALDIEPNMTAMIRQRAKASGLNNVKVFVRDFRNYCSKRGEFCAGMEN